MTTTTMTVYQELIRTASKAEAYLRGLEISTQGLDTQIQKDLRVAIDAARAEVDPTPRTQERIEFLEGVLETALEQGIGYWADIKHEGPQNHRAPAVMLEGDTDEWQALSIDMIDLGIQRIKAPGFRINERTRASILLGDQESDAGQIDADDADAIVQAGMFGHLVYG